MGPQGRSGAGSSGADGPVVLQMRTKLVDNGHDFWIETMTGRTVYKVDGKILPARDSFTVREASGEVVARMQERVARVADAIRIDRPSRPTATIRRDRTAPQRDRYVVEADDVGEIAVLGDVAQREYTLELGGRKIAEVSNRWRTLPDTFGVQVEPGADVVLALVAAVALDALSE